MRRALIAAGVTAAVSLVVAGPTAAHVTVNAHAAMVARLKARVATLQPLADAQVAAAAAQGPTALGALVHQAQSMPMPAPNETSPAQYALLVALQKYGTTTSTPVVDNPNVAGAATCYHTYGPVGDHINYYVGPVHVGWMEKDHGYWCGNGSRITDTGGDNYGYYDETWNGVGYCQVTIVDTQGWDIPYSWLHSERTTHLGNITPWGSCITFEGNSAAVRLAANGHWDTYNDID